MPHLHPTGYHNVSVRCQSTVVLPILEQPLPSATEKTVASVERYASRSKPFGNVRQQALVWQTGLGFHIAGQPETKSSIFLPLRRKLNFCPVVGCRLRVWQCFSTLSGNRRKQSRVCQGCNPLTAIQVALQDS